jgi:quercetin dioxygenase-like cupin family protein
LVLFAGQSDAHFPRVEPTGGKIMTIRNLLIAGVLAATAIPVIARADSAVPLRETVTPAFQHAIPNVPGKSLISAVVSYAPGAKSVPHHHAGSAFIYAYVLSGAIRSQVDDQTAKIYHAGESWFEEPGAHHRVSENASSTEPAQLLAVFVVDTDDHVLATPDAK